MENYTHINQEDTHSKDFDEIIPVAVGGSDGSELVPEKQESDDDLIVRFKKPFVFEGETFTEVDLSGLDDLKGKDLTTIEKAFIKTGLTSFAPVSTTTYAKVVATHVTGLPAEFFEELKASVVEKIKNVVVGFLYNEE